MAVEVNESQLLTGEQTRLYTMQRGQGIPLVFCNGIGVSTASFWHDISQPLARYYRTVHWDYRGHGRSEPPHDPSQLSIRRCAEDLALVLDHHEIEQAVVVGHSMGVQVALEFFRLHPERVAAMIPVLGTFEHPFNTFMRFSHSPRVMRRLFSVMKRFPRQTEKLWPWLFHPPVARPFAKLTRLVNPKMFPNHELDLYLQHLQLLSPDVMRHLAEDMQAHSARDLLPAIDVPCLIFAGENDIFTPIEAAYEMQSLIPNAELQVVKQGSHAAMVEQPDLFWLRMHYFLQQLQA